jgi:hypothetical protein
VRDKNQHRFCFETPRRMALLVALVEHAEIAFDSGSRGGRATLRRLRSLLESPTVAAYSAACPLWAPRWLAVSRGGGDTQLTFAAGDDLRGVEAVVFKRLPFAYLRSQENASISAKAARQGAAGGGSSTGAGAQQREREREQHGGSSGSGSAAGFREGAKASFAAFSQSALAREPFLLARGTRVRLVGRD